MAQEKRIEGTAESWEHGDLGRSAEHAQVVDRSKADMIDDSMGLKTISIRLQHSLIDDLKLIAEANGIGYQPLIRTLLTRFAQSELRRMARDQAALMKEAAEAEQGSAASGLELPAIAEILDRRKVA